MKDAIQKFLEIWRTRAKYHFGDRELMRGIRLLYEAIGESWRIDPETPQKSDTLESLRADKAEAYRTRENLYPIWELVERYDAALEAWQSTHTQMFDDMGIRFSGFPTWWLCIQWRSTDFAASTS